MQVASVLETNAMCPSQWNAEHHKRWMIIKNSLSYTVCLCSNATASEAKPNRFISIRMGLNEFYGKRSASYSD